MAHTRRLLFNAATFIPGIAAIPVVKRRIANRVIGTGGTDSGRYCYSVWLRHLVCSERSGLPTNPRVVAELGPGDSLGTGLAALLSGAERYIAFDVVAHANAERNLAVLAELVSLFEKQADIPGDNEFPAVSPKLNGYEFPQGILPRDRIAAALQPNRVAGIRQALANVAQPNSRIQYRAPWFGSSVIEPGTIDLIFSQAVLEHVDHLEQAYRAMRLWLAPAGFLSHQIDFSSHGWTEKWDGHWTESDLKWKLIRGKDSWSINREPESTHLRLLEENGFRVVRHQREYAESHIMRSRLGSRFRGATAEDLTTRSTFLQAVCR
jgi:Methyltransferase domain